jgi:hypothetical protein
MKLHALIDNLSKSERQKLRMYLSDGESDTQQQLFDWISARRPGELEFRDEQEREEVFQLLFEQPYSREKDYLLRNAYRLLFAKIKQAVPELFCKRESETLQRESGLFVEWLMQRQLTDLAEDELQEERKRYQKSENLGYLLRAQDQWNDLFTHHQQITRQRAEQLIALAQQRIHQLKLKVLEDIRKEEIRIRHAERIILSFDPHYQPLPAEGLIDLHKLEGRTSRADYYAARAEANLLMGHQKIECLRKLVAQKALIDRFEQHPGESLCRMYISLALEQYLVGDYAGSLSDYSKAYALVHEVTGPVREVLIFNYAYSLLKSGSHQESLSLVSHHEKEMLGSAIIGKKVNLLFVMLKLMAGKPDDASRYLDFDEKTESPEIHFSMRLAAAAIEYKRERIEEAYRECQNLDQAMNYLLRKNDNNMVKMLKPICAIYLRFFRVLQDHSGNIPKQIIENLLHEMQPVLANDGRASSYASILSIWMGLELTGLNHAKNGK